MDEIVSSIEVSQDLAAWFSLPFLLWVVSFSSFCGLVQNFSIHSRHLFLSSFSF